MKRFLTALLLLISCSSYVVARNNGWDANAWSSGLHKKLKPVGRSRMKNAIVYDADAKDADEEYQRLGKEAQEKVGVPEDEQLPIKQWPIKLKSLGVSVPIAGTGNDAIYIDQERLGMEPFGLQRSVFYHEAVHVKYHDTTTNKRLLVDALAGLVATRFVGTLLPDFSLTKKALAKLSNMQVPVLSDIVKDPVLSSVVGYAFFYTVLTNLRKKPKSDETRADTEGAYASACYACVAGAAERRKGNDEGCKLDGYLTYSDLQRISRKLKDQKKLCDTHKNDASLPEQVRKWIFSETL